MTMKKITQYHFLYTLLLATLCIVQAEKDVASSSMPLPTCTGGAAAVPPRQSSQTATDVLACYSDLYNWEPGRDPDRFISRGELRAIQEATCQYYSRYEVGLDKRPTIYLGKLCGRLEYIEDGRCPQKPRSFVDDIPAAQHDCMDVFNKITDGCDASGHNEMVAGGSYWRTSDCLKATLTTCKSIGKANWENGGLA
ncbi:hypothetical protein BDV29DRAFT_185409 [Aspergillus leporis]|uniref:Prokaryotic phospholipase A2-domain-containing protein n=1 Tax=Aspergillus leporis TaxID=41062 RepID=A0A5N5WHJ4_9EURO|nr:hypothetical protein BDV29DRAFT_185409 [Aspergillus leporis]